MKDSPEVKNLTNEEIRSFLLTRENYRGMKHLKAEILERTQFLEEFYQKKIDYTIRVKAMIRGYESPEDIPMCSVCESSPIIPSKKARDFSESCSFKCSRTAAARTRMGIGISTDGHEMTNEELIDYYHRHREGEENNKWIQRKEHLIFRKLLRDAVPFLNEMDGTKEYSLYIHALETGMTTPPACRTCSEPVNTVLGDRFPETCSYECQGHARIEDMRESNLEKYGVEHHLQSEEIQSKIKETNLERFGTEHHMLSDEGKRSHRESIQRKHGVDNVFRLDITKQKIKEANLNRRGVENPMQSEEVKGRTKNTNKERYGVENPMQSPDVLERVKQTNLDRYGVEWTTQVEEVKEKIDATMMERYGVSRYNELLIPKDTRDRLNDVEWLVSRYEEIGVSGLSKELGVSWDTVRSRLTSYGVQLRDERLNPDTKVNEKLSSKKWLSEQYEEKGGLRISKDLGISDNTVYRYMKNHGIPINPNVGTSFAERQVADYVESLGVEVIRGDKTVLNGKELDIYIPSRNLAIEYNGLFWHCEKFRDKKYHLEKTEMCADVGIRLIHIFEDEWSDRHEQVKAKIRSLLGMDDRVRVPARKCKVIETTNAKVKDFYNKNHLQGHVNASVVLGLEYDGDLVATMSFKRTRGYMELVRYATSCHVLGGFSKLLRAFWRVSDVNELVSFADIRWSDGNLYEKNGWKLVGQTNPNYYYVAGEERILKQQFRRKKIKTNYPEVYSEDKTESQMTTEMGLTRIWDCGLRKYAITRPD